MTDFAALDRLRPLPYDVLRRQWVLSEDPALLPAGWSRDRLGDWYLAAHPEADVWTLRGPGGARIGWVLNAVTYVGAGWTPPATRERVTDDGDDPWAVTLQAEPTPEAIRSLLYGRDASGASNGDGFEGRWTAIVVGEHGRPPLPEVYLGATNSAVFSPSRRVVASTTNLIPGLERDVELCQAVDAFRTGRLFTFGLLPFRDAVRLLPGQRLSLDAFTAERHWPVSLLPEVPSDTGVQVMIEQGRRVLDSFLPRHRSFVIQLTAGRDTRAALAICRPLVDRDDVDLHASTIVFRSRKAAVGSRIDAQSARALARVAHVRHRVEVRHGAPHGSPAIARNFVAIGEVKSGTALLDVKDPPDRARQRVERAGR